MLLGLGFCWVDDFSWRLGAPWMMLVLSEEVVAEEGGCWGDSVRFLASDRKAVSAL